MSVAMMDAPPKYSPWGYIQHSEKIADGIWWVSTSSHGGFKLARQRNAQIPKVFRKEGGWYEEDCDWEIVRYFFSEFFPEKDQAEALKTLKNWHWEEYESYLGVTLSPGESYKKDQRTFDELNRENWVVFSASSNSSHTMVECIAAKGGRGDSWKLPEVTKTFLVPMDEYQTRNRFGFVIDPNRHQEI
jgi:hypothetical protein